MMERKTIRLMVGVIGVALIVQFAYGKIWDEPYPAVILPGFGGVAHPGSHATTKEATITVQTAGGETETVDASTLFGGIPGRRARGFLRNIAPSGGELSAPSAVMNWLAGNLEEALGASPTSLKVTWRERRYRRSDWTEVEAETLAIHRLTWRSTDSTDSKEGEP